MKKRVYVVIVLLLASLSGCESKVSEVSEIPLPEVNDENCLPENVAKMTPGVVRERFASSCLRRGNIKPSEPKEW